MSMFSFSGVGFVLAEMLFSFLFFLIATLIVINLIRGIGQWNKNNHSPRLTVSAKVVAKREDVSAHSHHNATHGVHYTHSTAYFVTFQVDSGDRMELAVDGPEYGMLVEGDAGELTFQGTRYLGFARK
ncbi:MAG: DUF2500 domain-containing protein [Oscillibacter sp.]|nr:DUF2500 domain-containing protein [Oscillibacter sp.]MBQ9618597.1 DUF2500 domain-containing protein [Oscillibacter sp.]